MKRQYNLFIKDMLECIERIEEFTGNMDFKEFLADDKTKSAVVRKLEIIGEATKNIPAKKFDFYMKMAILGTYSQDKFFPCNKNWMLRIGNYISASIL